MPLTSVSRAEVTSERGSDMGGDRDGPPSPSPRKAQGEKRFIYAAQLCCLEGALILLYTLSETLLSAGFMN